MVFCTHCRINLDEGTNFCPNCGKEMTELQMRNKIHTHLHSKMFIDLPWEKILGSILLVFLRNMLCFGVEPEKQSIGGLYYLVVFLV